MESPNAQFCKEAMHEEFNSLKENCVYEYGILPPAQKLIDSNWVLKTKLNPNGKIVRYKARLVAKGNKLWRNIRPCCKVWYNKNSFSYCCKWKVDIKAVWCQDSLFIWKPGRSNLYQTTRRIPQSYKVCMEIEEKSLWTWAVSKMLEWKIGHLHEWKGS